MSRHRIYAFKPLRQVNPMDWLLVHVSDGEQLVSPFVVINNMHLDQAGKLEVFPMDDNAFMLK